MDKKIPKVCPFCKRQLVQPIFVTRSVIGIISEYPGENELALLKPFVGQAGDVLRAEMWLVGLDYSKCSVTNVWMHELLDKSVCAGFEWHRAMAIQVVKECKIVLLLGSTATDAFLSKPVGQIAGLRMFSDLLPKIPIYAAPNPAALFRGTLGETRLSLNKFSKAKELKSYGIKQKKTK